MSVKHYVKILKQDGNSIKYINQDQLEDIYIMLIKNTV